MATEFSVSSFLARWLFAAVLVFGTYNPTEYCYFNWIWSKGTEIGPVIALAGVVLLIAWIVFLKATLESLGLLGIVLGGALFGCVIWWLIDIGLLHPDSTTAFTWIILLVLSLILAAGMSWSHIRRRLTGQVDVMDDHNN
jgi:Family of unknown function (DUF6524)